MKHLTAFLVALSLGFLALGCGEADSTQSIDPSGPDPNAEGPATDEAPDSAPADAEEKPAEGDDAKPAEGGDDKKADAKPEAKKPAEKPKEKKTE